MVGCRDRCLTVGREGGKAQKFLPQGEELLFNNGFGSGQVIRLDRLEAFAASQEVATSGDGRASTEGSNDDVGSTSGRKHRVGRGDRGNRVFVLRASFVDEDICVVLLHRGLVANVALSPGAENVVTTTAKVVVFHDNFKGDDGSSVGFVVTNVDTFRGGKTVRLESEAIFVVRVVKLGRASNVSLVGAKFVEEDDVFLKRVASVFVGDFVFNSITNFGVDLFVPFGFAFDADHLGHGEVIVVNGFDTEGDDTSIAEAARNLTVQRVITEGGATHHEVIAEGSATDFPLVLDKSRALNVFKVEGVSRRFEDDFVPNLGRGSVAGGNGTGDGDRFTGFGRNVNVSKHILRDHFGAARVVVVDVKAHNVFFAVFNFNVIGVPDIFSVSGAGLNEVKLVQIRVIRNGVKDDFVVDSTIVDFFDGVRFTTTIGIAPSGDVGSDKGSSGDSGNGSNAENGFNVFHNNSL